jgi:hypothetical protein
MIGRRQLYSRRIKEHACGRSRMNDRHRGRQWSTGPRQGRTSLRIFEATQTCRRHPREPVLQIRAQLYSQSVERRDQHGSGQRNFRIHRRRRSGGQCSVKFSDERRCRFPRNLYIADRSNYRIRKVTME